MFVLSRRVGEMIFLPSICAYIQVLSVKEGMVWLSIEAPREVLVLRKELREPQNSERGVDAKPLSAVLLLNQTPEDDGVSNHDRPGLSLRNFYRRRKQ